MHDVVPHFVMVRMSSIISNGGKSTLLRYLNVSPGVLYAIFPSWSIVDVHNNPAHIVPCMIEFFMLTRLVVPHPVFTAIFAFKFSR